MPPDDTDLLIAYLADRDVPCPNCNYNLRGINADRCPECDQRLTLRVELRRPRDTPFLLGFSGLIAGLGVNLFLLIAALALWLLRGFSGPISQAWPLLINLTALGAALYAWLHYRPRLATAKPAARRGLIAACWLFPAILMVLFIRWTS